MCVLHEPITAQGRQGMEEVIFPKKRQYLSEPLVIYDETFTSIYVHDPTLPLSILTTNPSSCKTSEHP